MLTFGLLDKDAPAGSMPGTIFVGLNPAERARLDKQGFVEVTYGRLGLEAVIGEGSILICGTASDNDALDELRKRRPDLDWPPDKDETET